MKVSMKKYVLKLMLGLVVLLPLYGCGQGGGDSQGGVSTPRPPNSWVSTGEGVLRDEALSLSSASYVNGKAVWTGTATGVNNLPTARYSHTAVWTGSVMIVWGGWNGTSYFNTGGRYDPATDTWLATSTGANVPTARYSHTAIWNATGTEMIVWGGSFGPQTNTGGRYNPTTDSWTATSIGANVPTARFQHTAVWTGTEMIVWGGYSGSGYINTGGRYNPSSDSWTTTANTQPGDPPSARYYHTAVWTGSVMIVWGGTGTSYFNTGGRYDPATDTWLATSTGANVPSARAYFDTAVWSGTYMIVWGGYGGGCCYLNTGGRYNPSTDTWLATSIGANVPSGRRSHTVVWSSTTGEMIVWGGDSGSYLNTGGRYNPSSDSWTATSIGANLPTARGEHTAVWTGTEMIVWGGADRP